MNVFERALVIVGDKRVLSSLLWTISAIVLVVLSITDSKEFAKVPLVLVLLVLAAFFGLRRFAGASPNLVGTVRTVNDEIRQSGEDAVADPQKDRAALGREPERKPERKVSR